MYDRYPREVPKRGTQERYPREVPKRGTCVKIHTRAYTQQDIKEHVPQDPGLLRRLVVEKYPY